MLDSGRSNMELAPAKAQHYHTSVRTLDELGQAAGRLLALNEYLEQHPRRSSANHGDPQIRISKIQKMKWMEHTGKKRVVEFWLDVLVLEPELLDGVSIPWMLRIDELNEWVGSQPFEIIALRETACSWKEERKSHKCRTPMMSLMLHICAVADMINAELKGPCSYISCVPRYSVVLGKMSEYRGFCKGDSGRTKAEQAVLEALERATSTRVGKLSAVYRKWLRGLPLPPPPPSPPPAPLPPSPPLPPLESGGAAAPSGDEWAAYGSRPTRERERYMYLLDQRVAVVSAEPRRMEPGARRAAHIPKINAADVERMARVRSAGRIWDSPHTELDGNNTSWASSKPGQLVLRTPQTLVSVVCTI